jgi:hypothetical protein
VIHDEASTLQ